MRYVVHRLRLVAGARLLGFAVHVVEFLFLLQVFTDEHLGLSFGVRNTVLLAGAFWWGALEVLRNKLRERPPEPADRVTIERWLTLSLIPAAGILLATGIAIVTTWLRSGRPPGILEAYIVITFGRLAIDLLVRTAYSGIYARRRVYRPAAWILGLEMLGLASALLLWNALGAWAFPVALVISTAASRAATIHFTARAYRNLHLPVPRMLRLRRPRIGRVEIRPMIVAGASNATTRIGSALVLLLVLRGARGAEPLLQWLHVFAPLLATAASWSQVFYPDFKRLEVRAAGALQRRLERTLERSSSFVGLALSALAAATAAVLTGNVPREVFALVPLLVVQSFLGQLHLRYFARNRFPRLLAGGLALLLAIPALFLMVPGGEAAELPAVTLLLGTTAALGFSALVMAKWPFSEGIRPVEGEGIWDWTSALAAAAPVRVGRVLMTRARAAQRAVVVAQLEQQMGTVGRAIDRGSAILWFEIGETAVVDRDELLIAGGGLVDEVRASGPHRSGRDALRSSDVVGWLTKPDTSQASILEDVVAWFRAECPEGQIAHLESGACDPTIRRMSPIERQDLWRCARLDAIGKRVRSRSCFDVRAVVTDGEIRVLLLLPRTLDGELRRSWTESVRAFNWGSAVRPVAGQHGA